ncbi:alpha/beta fold hydrolase [Mycobacterium hubeiense]|uniref:alpha/beta fold hydrolase n=1 Tax=Mycobacterium hubeiense TaxID=1867256 RepID=UPI000C7EDEFE|nr:alpha/beta hydrolase [Mycobacterium sp. QGD 101]
MNVKDVVRAISDRPSPASQAASRGDPIAALTLTRRYTDVPVATRDGTQLAVRVYGPPTATHTVVFLHGFCLNRATWARQIAYLTRRYGDAVRIISYDHRGHGKSSGAPTSTYRIDQLATDLADVLRALNIAGFVTLVGHSMGGFTALSYLGLPAHLRPVEPHGLVLVATAAGKLTDRGLCRLLATPATPALCGLVDHTPTQVLRALSGPLLTALRWRGIDRAERIALVALTAAALATTPLTTAVGFLPTLASYDQHPTLPSISARTVIVSGGADILTPPAHSAELAAAIPGATHIQLPQAGHMLPQEAPHVINDAISQVMAVTSSSLTG